MNKTKIFIFLIICLNLFSAYSDDTQDLMKGIVNSSYELKALMKEIERAGYKGDAGFKLPDTAFSVMAGSSGSETTIMQGLGNPVGWKAASLMRSSEITQTQAKWLSRRGQIISEVRRLVSQGQRSVRLTVLYSKNLEILKVIESRLLSSVSTGASIETQLLMVQVEIIKLTDMIASMQSMTESVYTRLRGYSDYNFEKEDFSKGESPVEIDTDKLIAEINTRYGNNLLPSLSGAEAGILMAESLKVKAGKNFFPDIGAGVMIRENSGSYSYMGMVSFNFPLIFNSEVSSLRAAEAASVSATDKLKAVRLKIRAAVDSFEIALRDNQRSLKLYNSTVREKAEQNLKQAVSIFKSAGSRGDFSLLMSIYRNLITIDIKIADLQYQQDVILAGVESIAGFSVYELLNGDFSDGLETF